MDRSLAAGSLRRAVASLIIVLMGSTCLLAGCQLIEPDIRPRPPQNCAECHSEIYRQWSRSKHAIAWTNPDFIETSTERTEAQCLPCHAPTPLLQQAPEMPTELRDHNRHFGVDCKVCHFVNCKYAGPYDTWGPHPTTQETKRVGSAQFCGTCHLMELQEYKDLYVEAVESATTGGKPLKACAECHMAARRSRLTQGHILSLAHPKRIVRDHSFPAWTNHLICGAVEVTKLDAHREPDGPFTVDFTLVNRGAGHRIPTGKFGNREVLLVVELLDEQGSVLGSDERSLLSNRTEGLAPEELTPFSMTV
ncbi:MAG TPA: multiheme c-type cytochrome, partial [Thermoguttaceae bacterium]|nr:multiheme c-type cytochrome [Thermoguttaceae bacterium]